MSCAVRLHKQTSDLLQKHLNKQNSCSQIYDCSFFPAQSQFFYLSTRLGSLRHKGYPCINGKLLLSQSLVVNSQQLIGFLTTGWSISFHPLQAWWNDLWKGHELEYFVKPILCCTSDIFGSKTWGLSPLNICLLGGWDYCAPSPCSAYKFDVVDVVCIVLEVEKSTLFGGGGSVSETCKSKIYHGMSQIFCYLLWLKSELAGICIFVVEDYMWTENVSYPFKTINHNWLK